MIAFLKAILFTGLIFAGLFMIPIFLWVIGPVLIFGAVAVIVWFTMQIFSDPDDDAQF